MKNKKWIGVVGVGALLLGLFAAPVMVLADEDDPVTPGYQETDFGLKPIEEKTAGGLRTDSIPELIGDIIQWVLGIIGAILVALIIYGGFMYMTSAGDEKKIASAKRILTYAIVGAVIVFAAYIIAEYVISALVAGQDTGSAE